MFMLNVNVTDMNIDRAMGYSIQQRRSRKQWNSRSMDREIEREEIERDEIIFQN